VLLLITLVVGILIGIILVGFLKRIKNKEIIDK
jgi:uncharacterized membrane-anchored protein YhcB (DUF1043 family)